MERTDVRFALQSLLCHVCFGLLYQCLWYAFNFIHSGTPPGRLRTNPEGIKNHIKPNGMSDWGGGFKPLIAYVHWKVWVKKEAASEVPLVQDMRKVSSDVWRGLCMSHLVCTGGSEDLEAIISLISVGALGGGLVVNLVMSDYGCSWWS